MIVVRVGWIVFVTHVPSFKNRYRQQRNKYGTYINSLRLAPQFMMAFSQNWFCFLYFQCWNPQYRGALFATILCKATLHKLQSQEAGSCD